MNYKEFMNLFLYLLNNNTKSFLYSDDVSLVDNIKLLKNAYPYNVYIIDSSDYYIDESVVKLSNSILQKKDTLMNDYMNTKTGDTLSCDTNNNEIISRNIIFILNIHTFSDSNKSLLNFINSLEHSDKTHISFVSDESILANLKNIYEKEFIMSDFRRIDFADCANSSHLPCHTFKNYKSLTKYKKHIFPFDKIKVTKKRTEQYISNVVFIEDILQQNNITCQDSDTFMDYQDYKKILINFLLNDNFDYTVLFNVSHYENIPMILYENIEFIVGKTHKNIQIFKNRIRDTCLKYYSYDNDPDMYLFRKSNLYYFMHDYKTTLKELNIEMKPSNLKKIKFTRYYSNRASEIQTQNSIQSYSFMD